MMAEPERHEPDPDAPDGELVLASEETLVREMVVILSAFKRFSRRQIADTLKIAPEAIEVIRQDPEAHEMIVTLGTLLPRPGDLDDLLMSDAEKNIRWLRNLRDGRLDGLTLPTLNEKIIRARQRASETLLDRQVAKRFEIVQAQRPIDITDHQFHRMQALLEAPARAAVDTQRAATDADFEPGSAEPAPA